MMRHLIYKLTLFINFKIQFIMSEKSNKNWRIVLSVIKYVIAAIAGGLGVELL